MYIERFELKISTDIKLLDLDLKYLKKLIEEEFQTYIQHGDVEVELKSNDDQFRRN